MKAIFLNRTIHSRIKQVFAPGTISAIKEITDLDEKIYSIDDLRATPELFADVEYAFSTWGMPDVTEEEIKRCLPKLKCLFFGAGSVRRFARPFLHCGVKVFSAWAANAIPVAEFTAAQIILANKGYFSTTRIYNNPDGYSAAQKATANCKGNYGEYVGIIGAGMIGRYVIKLLKNYNLKILVFDPFLPDEKAVELGVEKCDLPTLFERSFVVSNHLANNPQTVGMIKYEHFSKMQQNGVFINTGRGAQVVEDDLARILKERPDMTALLDVSNPEPPVENSPFYELPNCILTPHIAGSAGDEVARMGEYMLEEFRSYVAGEPTKYEVTEKMLETMA